MRKKVWTASDLHADAAGTPCGEAVPSPTTAGGEAIDPGAPAATGAPPLPASAGGEAVVESDIRLKADVVRIGRTNHGLPLYRFRYKGGSDRFAGVMAQDVLGVMPEAVSTGADGYYRVDYGMLGIALRRL
jgi:hypothetical protein